MNENIINKYVDFEKNELENITKLILQEYYDDSLFKILLEVYINSRYYDYYERKSDDLEANVCKYLREKALELMKNSSDDNCLKIKEMLFSFNFILYIDDVKAIKKCSQFINYVSKYRAKLLKKDDVNFKDELLKRLEDLKYKKEKFLNSFTSNDFVLDYFETSNENISDVKINYNMSFPKLYSDYAIDRVFNTGVINEDKLLVEYNLISLKILSNVRNGVFDKYYLIEFSPSLFEKKEKVVKAISFLNNDCVKDKISLKVDLSTYSQYKDAIQELMKDGYMFAICLSDKDISVNNDFMSFEIFKYIIVNNQSKYCNIMSNNDRIICIDSR